MNKVKREQLKEAVNKTAPKLPENVVFIAGMRAIKNGQVQVEFAQSRSLAGRKASVLALLNAGDARFNTGRTLMRAWLMVNEEGFTEAFGEIPNFNFKEAATLAQTATEDEVVAIFAQAETINVHGIKEAIKIVCKETIRVADLPKSIREQLENPDVAEDIKNRYILQTAQGEKIVDEHGNPVYRHYVLSYGSDEDVLVENKILASDLAKKAAGVPATAQSILAGGLTA